MWCWRKMFKISYKEHVTNDEVLSRAKEKRSIIARITKQQKLWIGHNLRHPDNLLTLAIEGRFIGTVKEDKEGRDAHFLTASKVVKTMVY